MRSHLSQSLDKESLFTKVHVGFKTVRDVCWPFAPLARSWSDGSKVDEGLEHDVMHPHLNIY
jgi:hypothetical protein